MGLGIEQRARTVAPFWFAKLRMVDADKLCVPVWWKLAKPGSGGRFGKAFVDGHQEEWLDALRPGGQLLVERHLAAREKAAARFVLLTTDRDYLGISGSGGDYSPRAGLLSYVRRVIT